MPSYRFFELTGLARIDDLRVDVLARFALVGFEARRVVTPSHERYDISPRELAVDVATQLQLFYSCPDLGDEDAGLSGVDEEIAVYLEVLHLRGVLMEAQAMA